MQTRRLKKMAFMFFQLKCETVSTITKLLTLHAFFSMQIFHAWEKCRLADLKNGFYLFSIKNKTVSTITLNSSEIKEDLEGSFFAVEGKTFSKRRRHDVQVLIFG